MHLGKYYSAPTFSYILLVTDYSGMTKYDEGIRVFWPSKIIILLFVIQEHTYIDIGKNRYNQDTDTAGHAGCHKKRLRFPKHPQVELT